MSTRRAPIGVGRRALLGAGLAAPGLVRHAMAGTGRKTLRIGVLTALSGTYSDASGMGAVVATRLAVEDHRRDYKPDFDVEVLSADMQDKPEVGLTIAASWFDRDGVDAVSDVPNSAIALAVAGVVRSRNRVGLFGGPGAAAITGAQCSPNHIQWTWNTYAVASGTARALLAEGGSSWFFITADYVFGHSLQDDATRLIEAGGGRVVGAVAFPYLETSDFSSYLEQARSSGADVIGLACTASSLDNLIKQAAQFGVARPGGNQRLAGLLILIDNIHSIGLRDAQGLVLSEPFYWDLNEGTRAFSARFAPLYRDLKPSMTQAGAYAGAYHYLKAVSSLGVDAARDGAATVARMKAMPGEDALFGKSVVRADGSVVHDMHLFQVKSPEERRYDWDYYKLLRTIPGEQAYRPLAQSGCKLVNAG